MSRYNSYRSNYNSYDNSRYNKPILSTSNLGGDFYFSPSQLRNKRRYNGLFKSLVYAGLVFATFHYVYHKTKYNLLYRDLPKGFKWGLATSSFQVEGAWDENGKAKSIWDTWTHQEGNVVDKKTADVSADSYHRILQDIQLLKDMNVGFYRFSISWPRLLPNPHDSSDINKDAMVYYNELIDNLLEANIEPVVTLYHWDLPDYIQVKWGGWQNVSTSDRFTEYANVCYKIFGNRVKTWITFNEPREITLGGYEAGYKAPGLQISGTGTYNTTLTVLLAHAKAYHLYQNQYKRSQNGRVGIALNCDWAEAKEPTEANLAAQNRFLQWYIGIFAHPIFIGDFPNVMKANVAAKSVKQGFRKSRLPRLDNETINMIKGTADFLGLNHYTTRYVEHHEFPVDEDHQASFTYDNDVHAWADPSWPISGSNWLHVVPWGLKKLLIWLHQEYPEMPSIWITENGVSEYVAPGTKKVNLCDKQRIFYHKTYINEMLRAIEINRVPVEGYTAWSLMDNFEWAHGYTERFGFHWVNFNSQNRERIPKASSYFFKQIVKYNGFPSQSIVDGWESQALHECKMYTAMAMVSRSDKLSFNSLFIVTIIILYKVF